VHSHCNQSWNSNLKPLDKVSALASILDLTESELLSLSNNVDRYWIPGKLIPKKDGEPRPTNNALPPLKSVHQKIKSRILARVKYPGFLKGGIYDPDNPRSTYSNAAVHCNSKILIEEDISNFFPSIDCKVIYGVWRYFFNYSPEVSRILTKLTTYKGSAPQGWIPSSYLANLAFWDLEQKLVNQLAEQGFRYSRYVDDVAVSSRQTKSRAEIQNAIQLVYKMFFSRGFKPKRKKHQIVSADMAQKVTGLVVNGETPKFTRERRNKIRAAVKRAEIAAELEAESSDHRKLWKSAASQVGNLRRSSPTQAEALRVRLNAVKPVFLS